ncbi:Acetolactate synthase, mitochondrial [Metarhizium acridum]|nr:Acetolactate synthase, mitochondrial [Metarhizium acridum]
MLVLLASLVVLVTSGAGATNVITPQEADVVGISRACTKWNVRLRTLPSSRRINEAFEIATSGRPGPVFVDLPKDVTAGILRKAIPTETALPSLPSAASRAAMEHSHKQLQASIKSLLTFPSSRSFMQARVSSSPRTARAFEGTVREVLYSCHYYPSRSRWLL